MSDPHDEWLKALFEFEYCAECGGDAEHHIWTPGPFGLGFALCKYPPDEDGNSNPIVLESRE